MISFRVVPLMIAALVCASTAQAQMRPSMAIGGDRLPTDEEKRELAAYLAKHSAAREAALGRYAWAMLSSMEFFTNH